MSNKQSIKKKLCWLIKKYLSICLKLIGKIYKIIINIIIIKILIIMIKIKIIKIIIIKIIRLIKNKFIIWIMIVIRLINNKNN